MRVAAVVGAEYYRLLPQDRTGASLVLVVDVGGTSTTLSLVVKAMVETEKRLGGATTYSVTLPFGGNSHIDLLVSLLVHEFFGLGSGDSNNKDDSAYNNALVSKPKLNDPAALQYTAGP